MLVLLPVANTDEAGSAEDLERSDPSNLDVSLDLNPPCGERQRLSNLYNLLEGITMTWWILLR